MASFDPQSQAERALQKPLRPPGNNDLKGVCHQRGFSLSPERDRRALFRYPDPLSSKKIDRSQRSTRNRWHALDAEAVAWKSRGSMKPPRKSSIS
jgi:hypothetical protein